LYTVTKCHLADVASSPQAVWSVAAPSANWDEEFSQLLVGWCVRIGMCSFVDARNLQGEVNEFEERTSPLRILVGALA
jgi:hypothetical protein